jgi:hypothetical protein
VPGAPDYEVLLPPHGRSLYVELKVGTNSLEESQRRFFPQLIRAGRPVVVLRHRGHTIEVWDGMMQNLHQKLPPDESVVDWREVLF